MAHLLRIPVRDLASSVASEINAEHHEVVRSIADGVTHAIRAGELLSRAKANVGHGGWKQWQEKNLAFSVRTAQVYNAARKAEIGSARLLERLRRYYRERDPQQEPTAAGYGTDQLGNGGSLAGAIGTP
jgi:hypothetical protein